MIPDLVESFGRKCVLLEKRRGRDSSGGWGGTKWVDGAEFIVYQALNNSMEARIAEKNGVTSVYSGMVDVDVPIVYGDAYRDVESGSVFRVTSNPDEKKAPAILTFGLKQFTAEKWSLPDD